MLLVTKNTDDNTSTVYTNNNLITVMTMIMGIKKIKKHNKESREG